MSKIKFAHIAPTSAIPIAEARSQLNLVLAHLVGDNEYTKLYRESPKQTIMDNGAFELGRSMDPEQLIERAKLVDAEYIVLPDYPGQPFNQTVHAAKMYIPKFKAKGFKTFFVPQSERGDLDGYLTSWEWALSNPDIDLIGCSILGAPNALPEQDRLIARYIILRFISNIEKYNAKLTKDKLTKRIHMLGMLDNVHEISLTKPYHWMISSWDSSAATWYGMNGLKVEEQGVKFPASVDFEAILDKVDVVEQNINYINKLLK